ncbi:DMT family transporter [Paraburkholderia caballeronis]|uniref:DMT family transporter n=1 Tax=Paraburkholderia caballeronis TaxID=416943 RepID=UPI001065C765|nr:DMT family transporter [Paraburkholderia caballeronis]TDV11085.1 threonine/homoserine efflux transporter RhtA [Paraburkholderia caballeronis]TDV14225.1 threonine/homoserine efflux transporter RhtA [Paraburkholderia caballeronis]TDV23390.1 threonine/homoserine efflux transporter RhtA [Paraburkholderia caballeronis]
MNLPELVLLAAIWGASFLFMRVAAPEFGPVPLIALRVGIAALVLSPALLTANARRHFRANAWPLLVVGIANSALPFSLLAYSTLYVSAGLDSVLNATTPLWAALIAAVGFGLSMKRHQIAGLFAGFVGVVVLVRDTLGAGQAGTAMAVAAALGATLLYGFAVNYSKRSLAGVPPFVVAFGSQFFASVVLLPVAAALWPHHAIAPSIWGCVVALGVVCTGVAYLLFFRLVEHAGSAYAASVTFLIPIFGMIWGRVFLGETITPPMLAGCAIVLFGTALASGKIRLWTARQA